MAETRLTDIIDVTVFQDLEPEMSVEKTAFFQSGVIAQNALLDARADAPGKTAELPFWQAVTLFMAGREEGRAARGLVGLFTARQEQHRRRSDQQRNPPRAHTGKGATEQPRWGAAFGAEMSSNQPGDT